MNTLETACCCYRRCNCIFNVLVWKHNQLDIYSVIFTCKWLAMFSNVFATELSILQTYKRGSLTIQFLYDHMKEEVRSWSMKFAALTLTFAAVRNAVDFRLFFYRFSRHFSRLLIRNNSCTAEKCMRLEFLGIHPTKYASASWTGWVKIDGFDDKSIETTCQLPISTSTHNVYRFQKTRFDEPPEITFHIGRSFLRQQ